MYNFAGHDTMAITLSWSIYLLAAQDWIAEEINIVLSDRSSSTWNYWRLILVSSALLRSW